MVPAIEIKQLSKNYGDRTVLDNIDLRVEQSEMVALIGASGSGKSTLLRHIPGFVKGSSGSVEVLGQVTQINGRVMPGIRKFRSQIGFVFQQFNLVGRLPVITNVLMGTLSRTPLLRTLFMKFDESERQRALEALVSVGIEQTAWQRASTLSGGQQQRAALARCVVQGSKVVLADEPIASLDPEASRKVMEHLALMNKKLGCCVLVSLHQVDYALKYCARTVALHHGRVVYDGPSTALTPELLARLYGSDAELLFGYKPQSEEQPVHSPYLKSPLQAVA
jgi:phosphonate transport system ATP-binding protein